MKGFLFVIVSGVILILGPAAQAVRGQTSPPAAQQLLQQAQTAFAAAGSAHVVGTLDATVTGPDAGHLAGSGQGDISWRQPVTAHLTGSASFTGAATTTPMTIPLELIVVGNRVAVRAVTQNWYCAGMKKLAKAAGTPQLAKVSKLKLRLQQAATVTADTLNGVAVWHVRETGTVGAKGQAKSSLPVTVDLYIAQTGSSLLRADVTATTTVGKDTVTESGTVDFSGYGESVQAQIPTTCTALPTTGGLPRRLLKGAGLLLAPAVAMQVLAASHG